MIKRDNNKRLNINLYSGGGPFTIAPATPDFKAARQEMNSIMAPTGSKFNAGGIAGAALGALGGALGGGAPGETPSTDPNLKTASEATDNSSLLNEYDNWERLDDKNWKDFTDARGKDVIGATLSGATSGASGGPMGMAIGAAAGLATSGLKTLFARKKAKRQAAEYNQKLEEQEQARAIAYSDKVNNINTQQSLNMKSNLFSDGGMMTSFNSGGTHEENPLGGIPLGVGQNGLPNMVEEGEVAYNDYIYSNRGTIDRKTVKQLNLPDKYVGSTFAKIAEDLSKQNKERPNDVITNRMIDKELQKLKMAQEAMKAERLAKENPMPQQPMSNSFDLGGTLDKWAPTLRYAPILGNAGAVIGDLAGMNDPDYSGADKIVETASNMGKMSYSPIADYMTYNPMDTEYLFGEAASNNAATKRAIRESSGGNRGASQLALLAADQNYNNSLATIGRNADEYNFDKRHGVAQFNRGTNMFNKQQEMAAQQYNLGLDQTMLNAVTQAEQLRAAERGQSKLARQSNLNGLLESLGGVGTEAFAMNMIRTNPALAYKMGWLGEAEFKNSQDYEKRKKQRAKKARGSE